MIRTGHSFRAAVGHLPDVISRLREIGWETAPIADRLSTYAFVKWTKLAEEAGLRPVYGVELPVTPRLGDISPTLDHWTFLAGDALRPLHDLIARATANPGKQPSLTYAQATAAMDRGVVVMAGEAALLEVVPREVPLRLSPATPRGQGRMAMDQGRTLVAAPSNYYPREADREFYRVALGRNSYTRTYPCHIVSDEEWLASLSWMPATTLQEAQDARRRLLGLSTARLKRATLLRPPKPHSLRDLCLMGAGRLGLDVASDPVYSERLDRELRLIAEKDFEDYFFIIADMMAFARERMVVGPARGSSCGSLVCYLLGITAIDPIKFGLIFERFIDTTRADLPDIDLDFSDTQRHLVFEYMTEKYGRDRTARLGTVGFIKAKTTMRTLGSSLRIPEYRINEVSNTVVIRKFGDSRGDSTIADTFTATDVGRKFSEEFPEARDMAMMLENHPSNAGQHAAGVVLTEEPVLEYVAVDSRTGATMCDKRDAEDLNLLKIDALGLSQLSIFERCLELIGESPRSDFLEALPLDDQAAYDVLNAGKFAGIFQFTTGTASTHLVEEMTRQGGRLTDIEDIVSLTAIVRPGPLGSGAAERWIRRRCGVDPVTYSHPSMEPYLSGTYGIVVYQEQVMNIGREVGGLSWDDVTALRKAMSKSLGKEYFDKFGDKWKAGAASMHGLVGDDADRIWDDLTTYGMWAFNRSHSVAYGVVSYWCCWLKAHHPLEYAAAYLDSLSDPYQQIETLKELREEGVDYVAVDADLSTDRWVPGERDGRRIIVGPLTNVRGIGPKNVMTILSARARGEPVPDGIRKKLALARTPIDSLSPIADAVRACDLAGLNIVSSPTPIAELVPGQSTIVFAQVTKVAPLNENEPSRVAKRGGRTLPGPTAAINLFVRDDTGEVFAKIGRYDFERLGQRFLEKARPGKSLFAIKGRVPSDFRMISITDFRYLGEAE